MVNSIIPVSEQVFYFRWPEKSLRKKKGMPNTLDQLKYFSITHNRLHQNLFWGDLNCMSVRIKKFKPDKFLGGN